MIDKTPGVPQQFRIVTPEQLKQGWMELRGVTPIHHEFVVIGETKDGNYVVWQPKVKEDDGPMGLPNHHSR